MKNSSPSRVRLNALLLTLVFAAISAEAVEADDKIFNSKDLTGWQGSEAVWSVKDGTIVGKSKTPLKGPEHLWSAALVTDFYLAVDVKLTSGNQSGGIQFRSKPGASRHQAIGYQADMGYAKSHGGYLWGRLYYENGRGKLDWNAHGTKAVKPDDWNRYEILAVGHRIWTAVNGTLCTAVDDPQGELSGKIAFQLASSKQTIEIRIAAFAHNPPVELAGLTEAQLVAKLKHLPKAAQTGKAAAVRVPPGLMVSVFANHPQVTNPVAVDVDTHNRVYVAETFRFNRGTAENRTQSFMLEDDLQVQTLDDRMAMQRKWASRFKGGMDWFTSERDQINRLTDTDGDGRADTSSILATFREPLDGLAAGVLPWGDDIWVTCIPHLWRLRDADNDGKAEIKEKAITGFGVRASFFGHDMHGLAVGPDNRLYFSVGDRGFNVTAKDGRVLKGPEQGAVFRCRRDGSGFEVLHRGMRNPQEIAFDEWGNLFAGDNNCDKGDKSRLIYVIDGGDSGWRMHYQSVAGNYRGGPWMHEGMWKRDDTDLTPRWLTPSAGYIGSGPSGLAFSAVGAWPEALRNQFFHCNFSRKQALETFRTEPVGASFRIVVHKAFLAPAKIADCAFGYDGRLYAAEFIGSPWGHADTGHIFAVHPPETSKAALALTALAKTDFKTFADSRLLELLSHDDQRLRLRAQDELVTRGKTAEFATLAADKSAALLPRVHAIWGLWQIGLDGHEIPGLPPLLADENAEVRAQAWRVVGDLRRELDDKTLRRGLGDASARVQYFAVRAVGRVKASALSSDLLSLGAKTSDPVVEQAVVIALSRLGKAQPMIDLAKADDPKTRMIALLTLRQLRHRHVAAFLGDGDDGIALEAARAAHDLGIQDTAPQLAQAVERAAAIEGRKRLPMLRRVITANRIVGDAAAARRLCGLAVGDADKTVRELSLQALESWVTLVNRDPVTGEWRPIAPADGAAAKTAMTDVAKQLLAADRRDHWATAIRACDGLGIGLPGDSLQGIVEDPKSPLAAREAAFNRLGGQAPGRAATIGAKLLAQPKLQGRLAKAINAFMASSDLEEAIPVFSRLTVDDAVSIAVRQSAIAALTASKAPAAHDALRPVFDLWRAGKAPPGLLVELHAAAAIYKEAAPAKDDAALRLLHGGDAGRGRELFTNHQAAQCMRCHRMGKRSAGGGDAGPDLTRVGQHLSAPQLVEALLNPGARIAPGFGIVSVTRKDGTTVAGLLRSETATHLEIAVGDDPPKKVAVADIASRSTPVSAMPPMGAILKQHEIRDIVAFLAATGPVAKKRPPVKKPQPAKAGAPAQARPPAAQPAGVNVPAESVPNGSKPNIKPNVVVVFVDDLGWTDLGCYGSTIHETPHIDKLARASAKFTRAYSSCCVCSPTRAALMTGKYHQRIGFTDFLRPTIKSGPNSAATHVPASETTLAEAFQQAGYRTGYIGKWHIGSKEAGMPKQQGFDWQTATAEHGYPGSYFFPYKRNKKRYGLGDVPDLEDGKPGDYLTDVLTDRGIGFVKETVKEGKKPFFLVMGHYAVHTPIQAPAKLVAKYKTKMKKAYGSTPLKMIPERFNHSVPARQQNAT